MRIGIIGGGISGLAAAYFLRLRHHVTLFEARSRLGGHTHTVDVRVGNETHAVDTGFIVFNTRTYPAFIRLLAELGVESQPTQMSFSVRNRAIGLEYSGTSLNGLFAQRRNLVRPRFWRLLRDFPRFRRGALEAIAQGDETLTIGAFLEQQGLSRAFAENYLLPIGSAIWSCPRETFRDFPIVFIARFFDNHGLLGLHDRPQWRVIQGGSRQYLLPLAEQLTGQIETGCPVEWVHRFEEGIEVGTPHGSYQFDHLIFACHSDQALAILGNQASPLEGSVLSCFPYQRNEVTLHTDTSILPRRRRAWASWNYDVPEDVGAPATVTYNMNILQGIRSRHVFCVTLNSDHLLDESQIYGRFVYHHPIYTARRTWAQDRHEELIHHHHISYCGAYWGNGFHEDGVQSALAVANRLDPETKWKAACTKAGSGTVGMPRPPIASANGFI